MSTYNVSEFAKLVGVSVITLQRWDREGKLKPGRTPGNRRVYTDEHLAQVIGQPRRAVERVNLVYARVSSPSQKDDLEQQVKALEAFCTASGIAVSEWVREIGGGLSFKRKKFRALLQRIEANQVDALVVAHKDRLSRFGFDLIAYLCELHGTKLVVMNSESLSPEREMVEDVLAILHCFSSRLYGTQGVPGNYQKAIQQALTHDPHPQDSTESHS